MYDEGDRLLELLREVLEPPCLDYVSITTVAVGRLISYISFRQGEAYKAELEQAERSRRNMGL